ncbi:MAG: hypothetical protein K2L75_04365 [Muribaculaceae bacterium]|nr:hypothetical protein [Muribaculaceae bacterium]
MSSPHSILRYCIIALRSQRGRDTMMFLLFIVISCLLWAVMSLNDEKQYDLRLPMRITNVPDSVTLISPGPEALSVSIRAKGTQLMKMTVGRMPTVNVDFRAFRSDGNVHLSSTDLKGLVRNATGGSQVSVVYPDSLILPYTTNKGIRVPVRLDYKVTAGSQSALTGRPRMSPDSVLLFVTASQPDRATAVSTEPIRMLGIDKNTTQRVKLIAPEGSRLIPDSIDVSFEVEPLIFKSRKVVIEPVNVPEGTKLITFPAQIDVFFMVPASGSRQGENHFRVVADYRTIKHNSGSKNVKLSLINVPSSFQNVHLSADSAEYIIERH